MEKENIKKLFKDFNWKLPETNEEEWQNKYHFRDILRVIEEAEKQINLSLGNVVSTLKCDCGNTEDVKNIPICASCYNPHTGEW